MRFISKLAMTAAAIFFALSVSAHASYFAEKYGSKSEQVCFKWVNKTGWLPAEQMIICRRVLTFYSAMWGGVNSEARDEAKDCLRGLIPCPTESQLANFGI